MGDLLLDPVTFPINSLGMWKFSYTNINENEIIEVSAIYQSSGWDKFNPEVSLEVDFWRHTREDEYTDEWYSTKENYMKMNVNWFDESADDEIPPIVTIVQDDRASDEEKGVKYHCESY